MRVDLNEEAYKAFIEEKRQIFKARMLDYFIARKTVVEGVKKREPLEEIEEYAVDVRNDLRDIAHIGMLLLEPKRFFDIDRRLFQISPTASEYQYDKDGNAWLGVRFKEWEDIPPVPTENSYIIKED